MQILVADESRLVRDAIIQMLLACGIKKKDIASVECDDDIAEYLALFPVELLIYGGHHDMKALDDILDPKKHYRSPIQLKVLFVQNSAKNIDINGLSSEISFHIIHKPFSRESFIKALEKLTRSKYFSESLPKEIEQVATRSIPEESHKNSPPTILIVEDEPSNIDVAISFLKNSYKILVAKNVKQAFCILQKQHEVIDLILSDIMMPEVDGYEFCRQLKQSENTKDIPVIFLTAMAEVINITKGFSVGAVDYITKPLQGDVLQARVKTHVTLRHNQQLLAKQVEQLKEIAKLKEDVEKITQHDLKGPLASILFHAEQIESPNTASAIKTTVNNVISMINRSLELYKIEQGAFILHAQTTDLCSIIHDAVNAGHVEGELKEVTINTSGITQPALAYVDPLLCVSIFNNLIKNAVEASPQQGLVEVSAYNNIDGSFTFICKNEGVIPVHIRANLFNKYSTSNTKQGTGLGTYSAKLMVEAQNGRISFEVLDEKCTVFTVKLPQTA
ncbi:hybrid sensor histidine kinase/response regulator [Thalassotalea atypica]|uniref:hybrid sensor histidine kinase/response regulator n=1 Tax=Thalassotalea atypica TaxID=2054316 RepID=UPI0025748B95|nr:response regulator [Thalassotalea atypica]